MEGAGGRSSAWEGKGSSFVLSFGQQTTRSSEVTRVVSVEMIVVEN